MAAALYIVNICTVSCLFCSCSSRANACVRQRGTITNAIYCFKTISSRPPVSKLRAKFVV